MLDAASLYGTLSKVIDCDVKTDTVKEAESLTRKLRRVRQGLDLVRELFQNFLSTEYVFLSFISFDIVIQLLNYHVLDINLGM